MARLDRTLQRAAKRLRVSIAPGEGADIVEVWRAVAAANLPASGGILRDASGNIVRTNSLVDVSPDSGTRKVAAYYGRVSQGRGGQEGDFVAESTAVPHTFVFNAGDSPDIRGDDSLLVAVKRETDSTIEDLGWQPSFSYAVDSREQPSVSNGYSYIRVSGTTSGAVEPVWPKVKGTLVTDGDGQWKCEGELPVYQVVSPGGYDTVAVEMVVVAERKGGLFTT